MKPQPGDPAPHFCAPVTGGGYPDGQMVDLADLRGRPVVLVFYPKDSTPGCTQQACALRDSWAQLEGRASVFGVSIDPLESHRRFIEKQALPYPLLSDESHAMVGNYGVWVEKSLYGRKYMGTERTTFVIDAEGRIRSVLERVKPGEHLSLLIEALA